MTTEIEKVRIYRKEVPRQHKHSIDTRIMWLWNQRFGTLQTVWQQSPDVLDRTAATLLLQAILPPGDLNSIQLLFTRLEGGPLQDEELQERQTSMRV